MITGIIFCAIGLLHGIFKYFVIRDAARDVCNGGGVPVMDFVIFVPLWLAVGIGFLLEHYGAYPFPFFGLAAYVVMASLLYGLMKLEYRLGKPEVERQLREMERKKNADPGANGRSS
jgi:hypothetical protein